MAFSAGKSCPVLNILIFILTIATGVLCNELKVSYSAPYRAVTKGNNVTLHCFIENLPADNNRNIKWYKHGQPPTELKSAITRNREAWLRISNANKLHSGIYYCGLQKENVEKLQCGAEVNVQMKSTDVKRLKSADTMKDMLILIQGILLVLCLTLPGMLFFGKNNQRKKKNDEAETYHMYEGLEVMQTAMYEDIGNMRPSEDKWSAAEQPNE
ncbi:B-cell antigen receptor complex-associated protein beta chain [Pristis pectinata]|uniref:B-cell antigen receptor complex-associated protein beta chain n=1 Tax=Pristis pectinata TaxID=685728 RepID=UPI00223CF47A|nr:B-cell antigen receptor complex-associated protein beta chain [Pristis pectinata]